LWPGGNLKSQSPNPKQAPNPKFQIPNLAFDRPLAATDTSPLGVWDLVLGICLGFGFWNLEFGICCSVAALALSRANRHTESAL
jgi:hypothetical protein